jgi:hypothetical protein
MAPCSIVEHSWRCLQWQAAPQQHSAYRSWAASESSSSAAALPGWTQKYIRLMGLESKLRAYDDDKGARLWYLQGKRFVTPSAGDWPLEGLNASGRRRGAPRAACTSPASTRRSGSDT